VSVPDYGSLQNGLLTLLKKVRGWMPASITAQTQSKCLRPNLILEKCLVSLGPVVVFGAANFPLPIQLWVAILLSALARCCPVIVKHIPLMQKHHLGCRRSSKSQLEKTGMPKNVFQHLYGKSFEVGQALVNHPLTKAVGFTGSLAGGKSTIRFGQQKVRTNSCLRRDE